MRFSVEYPKTYVRIYDSLDDLIETIRRVDVQNSIEGRVYHFEYTIDIGDYNYTLTIVVSKINGEDS